jgi:hypothetical protein
MPVRRTRRPTGLDGVTLTALVWPVKCWAREARSTSDRLVPLKQATATEHVRRRDLLGGLIHEYRAAA